jgi:hypothetical protein
MVSSARRLLPYVNRYRRAFLVGMACVLATTTLAGSKLQASHEPQH